MRVRDEGIGIASELLPRVFDLFVQSTRASDREQGGLGIGLTVVERLVKLHSGSVEAHSEGLGCGSEFVVRLPILNGAGVKVASAPARVLKADVSRRILIVDDNEDSARSLSSLQRLRGHQTHTAFNGLNAVSACAEFRPEVVLLDLGLPGLDGFEVARRIRAMPGLDGTFIVAMTGYCNEQTRAEARAAGFDEYLVKPLDLELLREWLRQRP